MDKRKPDGHKNCIKKPLHRHTSLAGLLQLAWDSSRLEVA